MNPSPSTHSQPHQYILNAKNQIVQKLIFNYGKQMYQYQQRLLERYLKCREKQEPLCNKYQQHPVIKLEAADNNFLGCLDVIKNYSDVSGAIDKCVKQYQRDASKVFQREFTKCEQLLKQY